MCKFAESSWVVGSFFGEGTKMSKAQSRLSWMATVVVIDYWWWVHKGYYLFNFPVYFYIISIYLFILRCTGGFCEYWKENGRSHSCWCLILYLCLEHKDPWNILNRRVEPPTCFFFLSSTSIWHRVSNQEKIPRKRRARHRPKQRPKKRPQRKRPTSRDLSLLFSHCWFCHVLPT